MQKFLLGISLVGLLFSCNPTKKTTVTDTELRNLDTMVVTAPRDYEEEEYYELPRYNASAERLADLLHTKLDLRFDWQNEKVIGKATLKLKPYFYATDKITLDAKNFEFHKVAFSQFAKPLHYDYDGRKITIHLGKTYTRRDTVQLYIDYTASPSSEGGSAAILSDKGLYFINPRGEEVGKPQQIWTQGETEANSRWFPTIDKPNERTTQEMLVTVEDRFKTLSNGALVSSTKNADGTRTDYWKMDQPHAPYLFMLAIGEYAVVKEKWRDIPVEYYVEPEYEADAKAIFPHTPEMLSLFSDKLGLKYPWAKYAQVVVRDYVSGAMENTSATIFGEFMQKKAAELADDDDINETIVAHELFHHWFGDYVTCESWSNLTLNEGFATYSEYLWLEHKHGKEEADYHWLNGLKSYLGASQNGIHDLIDFEFEDKENMFDAHSYAKGGLILHMLRQHVGDEAFFAALNHYLSKNAYSDVEAHELRLAFEDVTGQDLNWFFNQWFFDKGQPNLAIDYQYDPMQKQVSVTVEQLQDGEAMPAIFQMPVAIDIYLDEKNKKREQVTVNQRRQTFTFPVDAEPKLVNFDGTKTLLCEKQENKSPEQYLFQYLNAPTFMDRFEALEALSFDDGDASKIAFEQALSDPFWSLRLDGLQKVDGTNPKIAAKLEMMVKNDPKPHVRSAALTKLAETGDARYTPMVKGLLEKEQSLMVRGAALQALQKLDAPAAYAEATKMENVESAEILKSISEIYLQQGDTKNLAFFEKNWHRMDGFNAIPFLENYAALAAKGDENVIMAAAEKLKALATNMNQDFARRYGATKAINDLHVEMAKRIFQAGSTNRSDMFRQKDDELKAMLEAIKNAETNPQMKLYYANFPSEVVRP